MRQHALMKLCIHDENNKTLYKYDKKTRRELDSNCCKTVDDRGKESIVCRVGGNETRRFCHISANVLNQHMVEAGEFGRHKKRR